MTTLSDALAIAFAHHQAGRLDMAEEIYRRIVAVEPEQAEAWHLLGAVAHQRGRHAAALEAIRQAIAICPSNAEYSNNLGVALVADGKTAEAAEAFRRALQLDENYAEACGNLGKALGELGRLDEAIVFYRQAAQLKPDDLDAALALGAALLGRGEAEAAVACYRRSTHLKPDSAPAHLRLGIALEAQGNLDDAVLSYRRALELKPDFVEAYGSLGNAFQAQGRLDDAIDCFHRVLELKPDYVEAYANLGNAQRAQGRLHDALASYRHALAIDSDCAPAHSNLLYALHFSPDYDARAIYQASREWDARHAVPLAKHQRPHANDRSPGRRLRVGYVSPTFCQHVVGRNLLPLFREHNRQQVEVFCYSDVLTPDDVTAQLLSSAAVWRSIVGLTDEQVDELIRRDAIDVLVDLTLHMAGSRLLVFARKPAPVQVTFVGYPGTTGLSAMDYRLTDPYLDPPGVNDDCCSETSIRLADTFWCYEPWAEEPRVNAPPALAQGYVTFGCLNNFCKVNEFMLKLWARVLKRVDGSHLVLLAGEGSHRHRTTELLRQAGLPGDRVTFVAKSPRPEYLALYHGIDIALDTLPYNGHTTSLDALWMGVPVITLVGQTAVGRAGLSQLSNLQLPELVADAPEAFIDIAVELAHDLRRLAGLRATLRDRMRNSPLMDAPRFARSVETAYRTMWRRWCEE